MVLAARFSAGRDLLLETWLISQMRAHTEVTLTEVTLEEYCRALEELAPERPAVAAPSRSLPLPAVLA